MDADLDTLATALYEDRRAAEGSTPAGAVAASGRDHASKLTDAELVCLAVLHGRSASAPKPAGCAMPTVTCGICSPTSPSSPVTTSACALPPTCCGRSSGCWPPTPAGGPMTCGSPTPPRSSVAALRDHQAIRPGRLGRLRLLRQPLRWFWGCGCTWSAPCRACRSASRWPVPRPTSARCCWASWPPTRPGGRPPARP